MKKLSQWFLKTSLICLTTLCLSFSQEILSEPTLVDQGNIIFTEQEFGDLIIELNECVQKDSLIFLQDSLITEYQYKDTLTPSLWEQEWFKTILYSLLGVGITKVVDNNVK